MIAIMRQFEVRPGREAEFEELHGAAGEWTALNRNTRSYVGTSFLRDQNQPARYIVVEYWSEMLVYEQHRSYRSDALTSLEDKRAALIASVEPLGIFTALDVPERAGPAWSQRGARPPSGKPRSPR
jgi:heme-degrading monooxygenase HmoA